MTYTRRHHYRRPVAAPSRWPEVLIVVAAGAVTAGVIGFAALAVARALGKV